MLPRQTKRWQLKDRIPADIDQDLKDYPPFFRQVLYNRGVSTVEQARQYLEASVAVDDPLLLKGMQTAVERIAQGIQDKEKIAVYGDYDVDGVTATALLVQVIRTLGGQVQPYIPNRFEEGYGLNLDAMDALAGQEVKVVVTVDCGIRSPREAERARMLGMALIISDHHQPGTEIPQGYSVICPKQPGDAYPDKDLSGVGIAYKIAQALVAWFPQCDVDVEDWLDLVALGTVSDVVPLRGENRSLVRKGLERMREARRPGLLSLANVARVNLPRIVSGDIGFMLGPRLNAAGRLDSALNALDLLLANNITEAAPLALKLDDQNHARQDLTRKMQEDAAALAQADGTQHILFAFDESFNEGVVGLAATRLVEAYYRPAIVGHRGEEFTRASCRSIPEFHITQALDECRHLLERHGGHAVAAGFTVRTENLEKLMTALRAIAESRLAGLELCPVLWVDGEIPLHMMSANYIPRMLEWLDTLQPTGQENSEAVFVSRNLRVAQARLVGNEGQHLKLRVQTENHITFDAIAFRMGHWYEALSREVKLIDLLYTFERNEYNGQTNLQLKVRDLKPAG